MSAHIPASIKEFRYAYHVCWERMQRRSLTNYRTVCISVEQTSAVFHAYTLYFQCFTVVKHALCNQLPCCSMCCTMLWLSVRNEVLQRSPEACLSLQTRSTRGSLSAGWWRLTAQTGSACSPPSLTWPSPNGPTETRSLSKP